MDREPAGTPVVVALPAEIDVTNGASVARSLFGTIDDSAMVIADMTGTAFCDSSGVHVLLAAHRRAISGGCELRVVVKPGGSVARVLAIVGLYRVLHIYASVADATPAASAAVE